MLQQQIECSPTAKCLTNSRQIPINGDFLLLVIVVLGCYPGQLVFYAQSTSAVISGRSLMSIHVVKHVPDLGNQHNNGPHQYKIFDTPPPPPPHRTLCSNVGQKSDSAPGGTDAPNRLFMKGVGLSLFCSFFFV